jgi:hypothetical protein
VISFELAADARVSVDLFDVAGRRLRTLLSLEVVAAGPHAFRFGTGDLSAGLYFLRLNVGPEVRSRPVVVLR